jgi:hypothetical protein
VKPEILEPEHGFRRGEACLALRQNTAWNPLETGIRFSLEIMKPTSSRLA